MTLPTARVIARRWESKRMVAKAAYSAVAKELRAIRDEHARSKITEGNFAWQIDELIKQLGGEKVKQ